MSENMSIGELARETGVKVVTVRYYEQVSLLPKPERTSGNFRSYTAEHLARLQFIRRSRDLGFSLDQIRELLRVASNDAPSCAEVCRIAERHLEEIEAKLADLNRLSSELRRIRSSCSGKRRMSECRIIEALSRG
jgi:DNA-binding transcriptional MerR regulator